MRLADLTDAPLPAAATGLEIRGLAADSRAVGPGFLFAALPGSRVDGRRFAGDAARRGAVAVLAPAGSAAMAELAASGLPVIEDADPRRRLALMAAAFHRRQPARIAAVTGTNGKTSVASFTAQILAAAGRPAASLGTLGVSVLGTATAPGFEDVPALTTPDPVALQAVLARLATAGVDDVALEASSHGLDQRRLDGVRLAAAAFTNLSRDHLDYHGDMDRYFAAKRRLFDRLLPAGALAVLDGDGAEAAPLAALARARGHRLLRVGRAGDADIRLDRAGRTDNGWALGLTVFGAVMTVDLPLIGGFQVGNALLAAGLAIGCGLDPAVAVGGLAGLVGAPGRIERCAAMPNGAPIYVDYAHTPDALRTVLRALRPHCRGRLVIVFGAGGDRDPGKRPQMGQVCAELADIAIVTDDNPRREDPATIRLAVMAGAPAGRMLRDGGDRHAAIRLGAGLLAPDDLLVIAGKGHEPGQAVGDRVLPFDDRAEAVAVAGEGAAGGAAGTASDRGAGA